MAKKNFGKRTLAMLMSIIMMLGMVNISVLAAGDEPQLVRNYEDTYYRQDGSAGTEQDWEIHLSKTAAATQTENVYDITLTVETKDTSVQLGGATHGAVTLVLDVSNSMDQAPDGCGVCGKSENHADHKGESNLCPDGSGNAYQNRLGGNRCVNCGQRRSKHVQGAPLCRYEEPGTHLEELQEAVADFLDSYVENVHEGDKRLVSVAVFGTDAVTIQSWVDVTNATALANVKALVNSLSTGNGAYRGNTYLTRGGTNIEAGLVLGRNLLNDADALVGIPVDNQSLILFSDGAPTARVGNVNSTATDKITYGGNDTGSQTDGVDYDDIDDILGDISAATIAVQYNYEDENNVLSNFDRIINSSADSLSVDLTGEAGKVITTVTTPTIITDPMGEGVSLVGIHDSYANETWNLADYTPTVADGVTTYTITYQVEIDPTAVEADPDYEGYTILTSANGVTTLDYTVGEDGTLVEAEFNVPDIRGKLSRHTVTANYVDADGTVIAEQVVQTGILYGKAYATEQKEIEGYTFETLADGSDAGSGTVDADKTVTYVYFKTPIPKYSVSYEYINAPEGAPTLPETVEYEAGAAVTVAAHAYLEGYIFSGWDKENFEMPAEDVVIKGSWTIIPPNKYNVVYQYEGDIPANPPTLPETKQYESGAAVVVAAAPELAGYTFSGWDRADFEMPAEDVVIKGSWTKLPEAKYPVSYEYINAPEGAPELPETVSYEAGTEITVAAEPWVEGYTFSGWDKEDFTMPAEAVVIKGTWTKKVPPPPPVVEEWEGQFVLAFDKAVAGDPYTMTANEFAFELADTARFDDGSGRIYVGENANGIKHTYTARNDGSGKVEITVPFIKDLETWEDYPGATIPGNFVYTLTEVTGTAEGMTYDPTAYTILVQLSFTQVGLGWEYAVNEVAVLYDGETEVTAAFADGSSVIHLALGENALYTNTYDDGTGALTITKTFAGRTVTTNGLAFRVIGPDSFEQVVPYADFTDGSYTLNGLDPGKYTVTEENAAVSGYRLTTTGEGELEVTANETAEITITNTYSKRTPYRPPVTPDPDPVTPDPVTPDPDPVTPDPDPVEPDEPIDIPDPGVPLIDEPDLPEPPVDIPDEEVPLADVPKTDDKLGLYVTLALLSGSGLAWLAVEDKKRQVI